MIKFEFTVSDADAENILSCIRKAALENDEQIATALVHVPAGVDRDRYIAAYRDDKAYLLGLIEKMHNTRV